MTKEETIGDRIKVRRVQLGMSQEVLAKSLGWGQSSVSQYETYPFRLDENGEIALDRNRKPIRNPRHRKLDADQIPALAEKLGCSTHWLLTGVSPLNETQRAMSIEVLYISEKIMTLPPIKRHGLSLILDIDLNSPVSSTTLPRIKKEKSQHGPRKKQ